MINDPAFNELFDKPPAGGGVHLMNETAQGKDLSAIVAARAVERSSSGDSTPSADYTIDLSKCRELPKPAPLANRHKPYNHVNKQERPAHRLMLEYAARGYNIKEIAELTGYTPVTVNNILRQENVQETLVETIRQVASADEEVVRIIKENVVKSVKLYEAVLNDPKSEVKDRMEAAERFLNRRYGKPNTPINRGTDVDLNTLSDKELLEMAMGDTATGTSR